MCVRGCTRVSVYVYVYIFMCEMVPLKLRHLDSDAWASLLIFLSVTGHLPSPQKSTAHSQELVAVSLSVRHSFIHSTFILHLLCARHLRYEDKLYLALALPTKELNT